MLNLVHLKVLAAVARHGSVTEAARELHYSQPSVSHHLARLETATGARLVQRIGRGIRLTPEGRLLAHRAAEIVGRVDAAATELAAQVGLQAGLVRVAANASTLATIVPRAAAALAAAHPGLRLSLVDEHPVEALRLLRHGEIDVAVVFSHADGPVEEGFRLRHLGDDPVHLISREAGDRLEDHRDSGWIGGCPRCQEELGAMCAQSGFSPRVASLSDDMVVVQSLVAAGAGVAILPGLALQAHRRADVHATETGFSRRIHAATYGEPPDPPAVAAVLAALAEVAAGVLA
ncbi:DNA-binding transcriptional regulator, LysR family [Amycolatopsis pretoriensis]|uniref:DNA-binding transcriptional regulator, LysR family n=1 Tax=Amycolatopsis pretoriensis TaxID=218821 RepID=A0A1H5RHP8_9PSEU|nr:LysR family transcriptional regulator [Amycolatopsis pretoriensis]SEF37830.1 DNA-binding transcriptional regulator, LysR family [Amycolatopsis pretoriensis]